LMCPADIVDDDGRMDSGPCPSLRRPTAQQSVKVCVCVCVCVHKIDWLKEREKGRAKIEKKTPPNPRAFLLKLERAGAGSKTNPEKGGRMTKDENAFFLPSLPLPRSSSSSCETGTLLSLLPASSPPRSKQLLIASTHKFHLFTAVSYNIDSANAHSWFSNHPQSTYCMKPTKRVMTLFLFVCLFVCTTAIRDIIFNH
jgi:hypothetical protein